MQRTDLWFPNRGVVLVRGLPVLLGLLVLLFPLAAARALDPDKLPGQYGYRWWTSERGLPSDGISSLAQTPDGYLWIGTDSGLVRTDGVRFTSFDRPGSAELTRSSINTLEVTSDGRLWIGTNSGLLYFEDGRFARPDPALGLDIRILGLLAGRDGGLWIGTYGEGLLHLDMHGRIGRPEGIEDTGTISVWNMALDRRGRLWFNPFSSRLFYVENGKVHEFPFDRGLELGISRLEVGPDGELWVASHEAIHRIVGGEEERIFDYERDLDGTPAFTLLDDRDGNLWIGTEGGGLKKVRAGVVAPEILSFGREALEATTIEVIFEDREGHLWVGTRNSGLVQLLDGPFTTHVLGETEAGSIATSVHAANDGSIWVATRSAGLFRRWPDGRTEHFGVAEGLPMEHLWAVTGDGRGGIYIATSGAGLVHRSPAGRFRTLDGPEGREHMVFLGLYLDGEDLLMASNQGLFRYSDGEFDRLGEADGLGNELVRAMWRDRSGALWIGTSGAGLHRLAPGREMERFGIEHGLPSNVVWCLYEDLDGRLFIGTDLGLARFVDGRLVSLGTPEGLPSGSIASIHDDGLGHLWLGTRRGVVRLRKERLEAYFSGETGKVEGRRFGFADGLLEEQSWPGIQPSMAQSSDGHLWFPGAVGVAEVDPFLQAESRSSPRALIEQVTLDAETRTIEGRTSAASDGTSSDEGADATADGATPASVIGFEVPPDTLRIDIRFTALGLEAPRRLRFRYRLLGLDPEWFEVTDQRRAAFTRLPPGDYRFEVTARDETLDWHAQPAVLELRVLPRFWQTPAFRLAFFGTVLLVLVGLSRARTMAARHREQELQERVDEALAQVNSLSGLIPICSSCKKIRDDDGFWNRLETYIAEHSDAELTHGLCPDCYQSAMQIGDETGELLSRRRKARSRKTSGPEVEA